VISAETATETLSLRPHVVATPIDRGAVLLDLESKYFYRLNSSGWAIVQMFEFGSSVANVIAQCRSWGAGEGDAEAIARLIAVLTDEHLVSAALGVGNSAEQADVENPEPWVAPSIERQAEPLHRVISSAFDPSIPLAE